MHDDLAIDLARQLIAIPSVNPDYDPASPAERDAAGWLEDWGRAGGFEVTVREVLPGRPNVVLTLRNGADHPHLLFNGHLDTVGVAGMTIDPFGATLREDRLWGRGAADMKGPLAGMLAAMQALKEVPGLWRGKVTLAAVMDEEHRFRGIRDYLDRLTDPDRPDFAVVGEPTRLAVVRGCKGCLRFTVRACGRAAHSSRPEAGRNAISALARAIPVMEAFFEEHLGTVSRPGFGTSTGSVDLISGGTGINIVPETASCGIDIRLIPGQDGRAAHAALEERVRREVGELEGITWEFPEPDLVDPSFELAPDHSLVREACEVAGRAEAGVAWYSCDASKIVLADIPVVVVGPGDIAEAHTERESIAVEDLRRGAVFYRDLALRLLSPD